MVEPIGIGGVEGEVDRLLARFQHFHHRGDQRSSLQGVLPVAGAIVFGLQSLQRRHAVTGGEGSLLIAGIARSDQGAADGIDDSAIRILGTPAEHWIGKGVQEILHPDDLGIYVEAVNAMNVGGIVRRRVRLLCGDGAYHWFSSDGHVFMAGDGRPDGFCAALRIVDAEVAAEAALDRLARYDQLTGLCNRSEGLSRLAALLEQDDPRQGRVGVLFVDVDRFKDVNDSCGHAAGDGLLQTIAQRLQTSTREEDLVARLGGDELLVALPGMETLAQAVAIAEGRGRGRSPNRPAGPPVSRW